MYLNYRSEQNITFQSGFSLSPLFGQALKIKAPGFVYIDAPADELSFTDSTATLTSFTIGTYFYIPETTDEGLLVVTQHGLGDIDISAVSITYVRMIIKPIPSGIQFYQTDSVGSSWLGVGSPVACSGWAHYAETYDQSTGTVRYYMNGNLAQTVAITSSQSCCSTGAYGDWLSIQRFNSLVEGATGPKDGRNRKILLISEIKNFKKENKKSKEEKKKKKKKKKRINEKVAG